MDQTSPAIPSPASTTRQTGFAEPHRADWLAAQRRLRDAGYGAGVCRAYEASSLEIAGLAGPEAAIALADLVSITTIKGGRDAAQQLCAAATFAARRLADKADYGAWFAMMRRLASAAPDCIGEIARRTEALLTQLGVAGLEAWILAGLRHGGADAAKRRAYFSFEDPEAERRLSSDAGETTFSALEPRLKPYLTALFGASPPIATTSNAANRRASFAEGAIRMPISFPGHHGPAAEDLFRAALAHIGAHQRYGGARFTVGQLKPVQIALVSLIEDARIERLAMRDLPGLGRLWRPFHIAKPGGVATAEALMARLARALIDPDIADPSGWVAKGRRLFETAAAEGRLADPLISREIGNLLGNDLGQMRVQFNAKTYLVTPPYRDDNRGLWDFPDQDDTPPEETEMFLDSARPTPPDDDQPPDQHSDEPDQDAEADAAAMATAAPVDGAIPIARYAEYDYELGRERVDWTTVLDCPAEAGAPERIAAILTQQAPLAAAITKLIQAARVGRPQRMRRLAEGDSLDLDLAIEAMIDLRAGLTPDDRVYGQTALLRRDLAVHVLLDISQSTADPAHRRAGDASTILEIEREAVALLGHAMAGLGDPFAVTAFCSDGREAVRTQSVKTFDQPFDRAAWGRLAGLKSGFSTRMGAALRHAGAGLAAQRSHRRLVMVLTDGEPSDIDCPDPAYLTEDARAAVHRLASDGIDAFCVAIGGGDQAALPRIFGKNVVRIPDIAALPETLPALYMRLSR